MAELKDFDNKINKNANPKKAILLQRFFKTGKGEYGEGDIFIGITVPEQRDIAKEFIDLGINELNQILNSEIHEKRLIGLLILIEKFKKAEKEKNNNLKRDIFNFYLKKANENKINNWDLVDLSSYKIVGEYLTDKNRSVLYDLTKGNLWEKRISIISTFAFIRNKDFYDSLKIAEIFLNEKHDLMHKAVGWMLREIGKKDVLILENFLKLHYKNMPRTMLRYSIEKFPKEKRKRYLNGEV